jgi:hypothetical protein
VPAPELVAYADAVQFGLSLSFSALPCLGNFQETLDATTTNNFNVRTFTR